jgi:post-segregation antitoxin (ccd killing protein)
MPKVSIYLPDDLYQEARVQGLPLSAVAQRAIESALAAAHTSDWVARVRARPPRRAARIDTSALVGSVRDEFGA